MRFRPRTSPYALAEAGSDAEAAVSGKRRANAGDVAKRAKLASVMSANGRQRRGGRNRRSGDRPRPATDENGSPNTVRADVAGEPKPPQLPRPYVVEPAHGAEATCSLLLLHGFACSGRSCAESWLPQLEQMGDGTRQSAARVFERARAKISCYGPDKPTEAAWHDYFSDHGGAEGRPEIEEDIDLHDLAESRRLGGCTALDAATTHAKCVGGVFCSFGQLYSATPVSSSNKQLKVVVWHGSRDATIAPSLCLRSLSRLLDRGYKKLTLHAEDGLGHCENSGDRGLRAAKALKNWGFVSRDKPRRVSHAAAPPPAKPELVEAPKKAAAPKAARRGGRARPRAPGLKPAAKPASPRPAKKTPPGSPKKPAPKPAAPPGLSKAPPRRAAPGAPAPRPAGEEAEGRARAAGPRRAGRRLSKGATRRCKACVSGEPKPPGMAAKPPPQAPVPMDEDSDSELEGYA
ncbi:hypothetical protein SO694_00157014 [Aureococcus anophagefferens]|uniref:Phospholipase/carboxylesterase/thioesterase domain-containing protein n=1 Tax=Aureococcus anophagefferens TaxID=44056 RepID=A0ABR1G116_AURAN